MAEGSNLLQKARQLAGFVGSETAAAIVIAGVFALTALLFNDYILPPPNLNGSWKFSEVTRDSTKGSYLGLTVTYKALIIQDGLSLSGTGEKVSELKANGESYEYKPELRTAIEIRGSIRRRYFSNDELTLHVAVAGEVRDTATLHEVERFSEREMAGCFLTTAASASGPVAWERVEWRGEKDRIPVKAAVDACASD